jgi:hypothetical protein
MKQKSQDQNKLVLKVNVATFTGYPLPNGGDLGYAKTMNYVISFIQS